MTNLHSVLRSFSHSELFLSSSTHVSFSQDVFWNDMTSGKVWNEWCTALFLPRLSLFSPACSLLSPSLPASLLLTKQFCQLAVACRICDSFWRLGRGGGVVLTGSTCCSVELAEGGSENEGGREERVEQTDRGWLSKGKKGQQHRSTSFCVIMCAERENAHYIVAITMPLVRFHIFIQFFITFLIHYLKKAEYIATSCVTSSMMDLEPCPKKGILP